LLRNLLSRRNTVILTIAKAARMLLPANESLSEAHSLTVENMTSIHTRGRREIRLNVMKNRNSSRLQR
jgi:hypothetical protein